MVIGSLRSMEMRSVRPEWPDWSSAYSSYPMWLSVGSRSSLIDGMGQVGMSGLLDLPYQPVPETHLRADLAANVRILGLDPQPGGNCRPAGQRSGWILRHTTSSGAALKMELYVPEMIPMPSASASPCSVAPPARKMAASTSTTVKLVMI